MRRSPTPLATRTIAKITQPDSIFIECVLPLIFFISTVRLEGCTASVEPARSATGVLSRIRRAQNDVPAGCRETDAWMPTS